MTTHNTDMLTTPKAIAEYARDNGLINLAENYSALQVDARLEQKLHHYILLNANVAAPQFGLPELRSAISKKTARLYDHTYDPDTEVTIATGVKQGISATVMSLLKEGDEVLIFEPAHKSYDAAIKMAGARPVYVTLKAPDFGIEWEQVHMQVTNKTRMVIINSPHFPTGTSLSELDMIRLQKLLNGTNIMVLSDESFEHVVFDGEMHQSVALYPFLRERSVIVSSFNETLHIPNWHVGYCMAPAHLMKGIREVFTTLGEGVNCPYQMAIADFINENNHFNHLASFYQGKRDLFLNILNDSRFKAIPSKGTYFQLICMEPQGDKSDIELAHTLMYELNLATVPIRFYYHEKSKKRYLRVNLSLSDETLIDAATRLKNW
ncbi:aminotransferase class I/II-fold pyridoxal phosphate-dependent enzyme [Saccharicrinis carchari]|nr:aminotransferase class I/II-fold pyridoxal phosphate-dependent enzyme [Saccharicrinis carchari]